MSNGRWVCISDGWRAWLGNGWHFWAEDNRWNFRGYGGSWIRAGGPDRWYGMWGFLASSELARRVVPQMELDEETETSPLFLQLNNWNRFNKELD